MDGEIWDTPQKKAQAIRRLRQQGYRAQPLRRVYIDKSSGNGQRPLGIPCMIDRAFQMLYKFALDPIAETTGDPNSYGFRLGRSTADAIGQCFLNLCRKTSATWILEADLKACFDTINHQWLDDFIVTGSSHEILEQQVIPLLVQFLGERGLELSTEKTRITHIEQGVDFLGQNVRKYKGKLLIKPSRKSIRAFLNKVRTTVKANKQATAGDLINRLNPIIRGWANYHRHIVSKKVYSRVDSEIFHTLWCWAKWRHTHCPHTYSASR